MLMWVGQTISMVGSALASFAFGVWIFQGSGKVMDLAGMAVFSSLPAVLITPWAGSVADRIDRRYVILAADSTAALSTATVAFLLWYGTLEIWHLYVISFIGSIAGTFQGPAYHALASSVIPKDHMPRASGLMDISGNLIEICAPMSAGALMGYIGLPGVVTIDLITFCIGAAIVFKVFSALAPLGAPHQAAEPARSVLRSALSDLMEVMRFFKQHRLLLGLLGYTELQSALVGFATILITPLVLASNSSATLGMIMTIGSLGGLLGSGYLVLGKNPRNVMAQLLVCDGLISLCILVAGLVPSATAYAACSFVAAAAGAAASGLGGAMWMRKIPNEQQGRVFALTSVIGMVLAPQVALASAFLADRVFEPALAPGGWLAESVGQWMGTGHGRGLAFVFVISGTLGFVASMLALTHGRLRQLDHLVPDGRP